MDAIVEQAMRKWPNVPHCYGWLGLDQRGQWWLRDLAAQAAGDFAHSKGSRLEHTQLIGFIERNYAADAQGCWFFQNGPQRVFVELENTPAGVAGAGRWPGTQPHGCQCAAPAVPGR